jgi:hypothetical protein
VQNFIPRKKRPRWMQAQETDRIRVGATTTWPSSASTGPRNGRPSLRTSLIMGPEGGCLIPRRMAKSGLPRRPPVKGHNSTAEFPIRASAAS